MWAATEEIDTVVILSNAFLLLKIFLKQREITSEMWRVCEVEGLCEPDCFLVQAFGAQ